VGFIIISKAVGTNPLYASPLWMGKGFIFKMTQKTDKAKLRAKYVRLLQEARQELRFVQAFKDKYSKSPEFDDALEYEYYRSKFSMYVAIETYCLDHAKEYERKLRKLGKIVEEDEVKENE
jgi:hypothetical protein